MTRDELRAWLLERVDSLPFRDTDLACAARRIVRMADSPSSMRDAVELVVGLEGLTTVQVRGIQSCALGSL